MKVFKIHKKDYRNVVAMYKRIGAYSDEKKQLYVSDVYWTQKDLKRLEKNTMSSFKKDYPYVGSERLKVDVGMYMLNYSPAGISASVLTGYMIVDDQAIEEKKRQNNEKQQTQEQTN